MNEALNLTADFGVPGQVTLKWSATANEELLGWRIVKEEHASGEWIVVEAQLDPSRRSYVVPSLPPGPIAFHVWSVLKTHLKGLSGTVLGGTPEPKPEPKPEPPKPEPPHPEPQPKPGPEPPSGNTWRNLTQKEAVPASVPLFSPESFWRRKLTTAEKRTSASNPSVAKEILGLSQHGGNTGNIHANSEWGKPFFLAATTDPLVEIVSNERFGAVPPVGAKFHIPNWAQHATASDGQMTVIQPDGSMLDFYQVKRFTPGSVLEATLCSHTKGAAGLGNEGSCTAADFDLLGGQVRGPELLAGEVNHALFIVTTLGGTAQVPPARHHDGQEGWRLCLDFGMAAVWEEVEHVKSLGMNKYETAIAVAWVEYGGYVGDRGGSGFDVGAEGTQTYTAIGVTNPWNTIGSVAGCQKIPWSSALKAIAPPPSGTYMA